jgi:hypothetical protein
LVLVSVLCLSGGVASAQSAREPLLGRNEVAAVVSWMLPTSFGSRDASLTAASGDRYRLFSTSTELAATPAFDVRIGRRLTRVIQADLSIGYASPMLTTTIDHDAENGSPTVAAESIRQLTIVGTAVVYVPRWRLRSQILPFVSIGGGYLRQIHEGNTLAETGGTYQVGAGVMIPVVSRGRAGGVKQFGLRSDVRLLFRTGGVTNDRAARRSPALGVSVFARF